MGSKTRKIFFILNHMALPLFFHILPRLDKALLKVNVSPDFLVHPLLELLVQHEQVQNVDRTPGKKKLMSFLR